MSEVIPQTTADFDHTLIIERPDGFYWQDQESGREFGPFATLVEAVADMSYDAAGEAAAVDALREAEDEIGIADWVDADTGLPAEEGVPRIEDWR